MFTNPGLSNAFEAILNGLVSAHDKALGLWNVSIRRESDYGFHRPFAADGISDLEITSLATMPLNGAQPLYQLRAPIGRVAVIQHVLCQVVKNASDPMAVANTFASHAIDYSAFIGSSPIANEMDLRMGTFGWDTSCAVYLKPGERLMIMGEKREGGLSNQNYNVRVQVYGWMIGEQQIGRII